MKFDFREESVDNNTGNATIFNEGEAGKVDTVKLAAEKKGLDYNDDDSGKKLPDYRLIYTDSKERSINTGFYYLDEDSHNPKWRTFDEAVHRQWKKLAHIVEIAGGDPGIDVDTPIEMLDQMITLIKTATKDKTFNVYTNYGHTNTPKQYLEIRNWVPFIETSDTVTSKLKKTNIDQIDRLTPDPEISVEPKQQAIVWDKPEEE